ncbi:MAG: hypothetical protein BHW45_07290 [Roseburia sp. CAG:197_41_10]|nr:MAG: hypothetical protein BHW45_07290 [Roseburia sp. CAG:197_41_10]
MQREALTDLCTCLNFKPETDEAWQDLAQTYTDQTGVDVRVVTAADGQYDTTLQSVSKSILILAKGTSNMLFSNMLYWKNPTIPSVSIIWMRKQTKFLRLSECVVSINPWESYSSEAMQQLLSKKLPITAVFVMSDVMAIGAMRAIFDAGLCVPEDISMIGFDGTVLADYYNPKIVTICQQYDRIAQRSVEILLSMIDLNKPATHELIPFSLKNEESVIKK